MIQKQGTQMIQKQGSLGFHSECILTSNQSCFQLRAMQVQSLKILYTVN